MLKQRTGATVPPHTSIGVGPPCRQNRKVPRPGIEPGLQQPESDADPTELNRFGIIQTKLAGKNIFGSDHCPTGPGSKSLCESGIYLQRDQEWEIRCPGARNALEGFRVWGLGFAVQGLGFRVGDLGFCGSGSRV